MIYEERQQEPAPIHFLGPRKSKLAAAIIICVRQIFFRPRLSLRFSSGKINTFFIKNPYQTRPKPRYDVRYWPFFPPFKTFLFRTSSSSQLILLFSHTLLFSTVISSTVYAILFAFFSHFFDLSRSPLIPVYSF